MHGRINDVKYPVEINLAVLELLYKNCRKAHTCVHNAPCIHPGIYGDALAFIILDVRDT